MNTVSIQGEPRTEVGTKFARRMRKQDLVPCVLYSAGKEATLFTLPTKALKPLIYTPDFKLAEIEVDGKVQKAVVKDLQFHPVTDKLLHADFQALVPGTPIIIEVPIKLEGLAAGVRGGGKLLAKLRKLKIKATPENMVSEVVVDVTDLEVGKSVRVRDVDLPNVQIMNSSGIPLASVEITRALRSAAAQEDGEGEVEAETDAAPTEE